MSPEIAIATCKELPDLDPDDQPLIGYFAEVGVRATPVIWSDPTVDWDRFDRVVVRNTWDYTDHLPEFLAWVESLTRKISNSADIIVWNSDKTYLQDVHAAKIPVIATQFVTTSISEWNVPESADFVVKPSVSAGSRDTLRLASEDPRSQDAAQELIDTIIGAGKSAMIQPYLDRVDAEGETALLYIGGKFSHAIRKGPLLKIDSDVERVHGLYLEEDISPRVPRKDQLAIADQVMDFLNSRFGATVYTRVDLIDSADSSPFVLEVEAVEPSIFFRTQPGAYQRFVSATLA